MNDRLAALKATGQQSQPSVREEITANLESCPRENMIQGEGERGCMSLSKTEVSRQQVFMQA